MDEAEFKAKYRKELVDMLDECVCGDSGAQAILIVHTPHTRTISLYAVNADGPATQGILLSAVEPYLSFSEGQRTLN